jgi:hypothetical protein
MAENYQKLTDFLKAVRTKKSLRSAFETSPAEVIKSANLSPKHARLVKAGAPRAIAHAVLDEHLDTQKPGAPIKAMTIHFPWP